MESKKINQLATEMSPETSDLTIIGDPITGVSKKISLLQIANLFATTGTVSSVAVTETCDALTITGSPITTAGTINIGFAGAANQYVRGDGALADFPTSTGGGSSVSYYLNSSVSQGTIGGVAYRQLSKTPISGAGTDITASTNGYIASYITDANDPSLLEVPAGNFNCEFYFSVNSNNHNPYVYAELYKYNGTTFTLLGTSQSIPEYLSNGTTLSAYYFAIPVAVAALTITDRLAIRIYANVDGRVVTLHTENNHLCQVVTTFSKGLTTLNNLTRQVQFLGTGTSGTDFNIASSVATHTFNLPVASAINTGKLSSTDWSTFNNKENAITAGTTAQYYRGDKTFQTLNTTAVAEGTNLYFTDARARGALSFVAGSGAYNSTTGVITIPTNNNQITNGAGYITSSALSDYVTLATTQTISGAKTFSSTLNGTSGVFSSTMQASAYRLTGMTAGSGALYWTSDRVTLANYNATGIVHIEANGGAAVAVFGGGTFNSDFVGTGRFSGNLTANSFIKSGGTSSQYLKADGSTSTLTNPITGTGTEGTIPKFSASGTAIENSTISDVEGGVYINNYLFSGLPYFSYNNALAASFRITSNTNGNQIRLTFGTVSGSNNYSNILTTIVDNSADTKGRLDFQVRNGNNSFATPLVLAHTGAATFSSSVGVGSAPMSSARLTITDGTSIAAYWKATNTNAATRDWTIITNNQNFGDFAIRQGNSQGADATSGTDRLFISSAGNVGIGTTSPSYSLDVNGVIRGDSNSTGVPSIIAKVGSGGNNGTFGFGNDTNYRIRGGSDYGAMLFDTAGSERMRITSNGYLWVNGAISGFSGSGVQMQVNGQSRFGGDIILHNGSNAAQAVRLSCNGADSFYVQGALSKNSGSFRIDHPLESMTETHQLVHSFVEAPQADLYYRGKLTLVNGKGQANIDEVATMTEGTFEVLCREVQCFTTNESGWDLVKGKVIGNIIYIESQNTNSTDEISWLVIGERKDKHMMDTDWTDEDGKVIVEPLKEIKNK
jgi:hypothetical protein